jgi:mRNA interferase RelE/StbE
MSRFEIHLQPSAVGDLNRLRKYDVALVTDAMAKHLAQAPDRQSKSRIKRLRGLSNPDYRLRVGDFRIFYNIDEYANTVIVLRVLHKDQTRQYYEELIP